MPAWLKRHVPTRETVQHNRLLRPFARQLSDPALWRFHRRSVARGVALGLGVGVIIPFMHTVIASILAIPTRANVVVAAGITWLINPFTIGPLYYAAYRVGSWELRHDTGVVNAATAQQVTGELQRVLFWIHHASGPIAVGVVTIAIAIAALSYTVTTLSWRLVLVARWRRRRRHRSRLESKA